MKTLSTLIADIYGLFTYVKPETSDASRHKVDEANLEKFACNVARLVKMAIEEKPYESVTEKPSLRISKIGTPDRKLWFELNDPSVHRKSIDPATAIKFLYGHLLEELLLFLVKEAGHEVAAEQQEVLIRGVLGHKDCTIDGTVVDVKSASRYSFQKFVDGSLLRGEDPFGYVAQVSGYSFDSASAKPSPAAFLVINKESGELCLLEVPTIDMINPEQRIKHIQERVLSQTTAPVEKCYPPVASGKGGNEELHRSCTFCPYKFKCWGKELRAFKYASGLKYLTKVSETPRVEEVILNQNHEEKEN